MKKGYDNINIFTNNGHNEIYTKHILRFPNNDHRIAHHSRTHR